MKIPYKLHIEYKNSWDIFSIKFVYQSMKKNFFAAREKKIVSTKHQLFFN